MAINIKTLTFLTFLGILTTIHASYGADIEGSKAKLGMLDKITGRFKSETVAVGETLSFGNLRIKVNACIYRPPEETPENTAYLEIYERKNNERIVNLFKGWMFSSNQVVTLDNPIFDVWVLSCE